MKPYLCWLLTGLLLLTGCVQPSNEEKAAARPTVTVTYYSEPTAVAPAAELPDVAGYDDFMSVLSAAVLSRTHASVRMASVPAPESAPTVSSA